MAPQDEKAVVVVSRSVERGRREPVSDGWTIESWRGALVIRGTAVVHVTSKWRRGFLDSVHVRSPQDALALALSGTQRDESVFEVHVRDVASVVVSRKLSVIWSADLMRVDGSIDRFWLWPWQATRFARRIRALHAAARNRGEPSPPTPPAQPPITSRSSPFSYAEHRDIGASSTAERLGRLERNLLLRAAMWTVRLPLRVLGGRRVRDSYPATAGRIFRARDGGELLLAIDIALDGCERFRGQRETLFTNGADAFWMCLAEAASAGGRIGGGAPWQRIIDVAELRPEPVEGLNAARAMLSIARHFHDAGDKEQAVAFTKLSLGADATWPSSRVFAAWVGLHDSRFNTAKLLAAAIALDASLRKTLATDPAFAGWPGLADVLNESIN
jgi:hypothetical protein